MAQAWTASPLGSTFPRTIPALLLCVGLATAQTSQISLGVFPDVDSERIRLTEYTAFEPAPLQLTDLRNALLSRMDAGRLEPNYQSLIAASERSTAAIFRISKLLPRRSISFDHESGDSFLAEWTFEGQFGTGSVLVEDTPISSVYYFTVPTSPLRLEAMRPFLDSLFQWTNTDLSLRRLVASVYVVNDTVQHFLAVRPATLRRQVVDSRELLMVEGEISRTETVFRITVGKDLTRGLHAYIRERAPVLEQRVGSWSTARLASELGRAVSKIDPIEASSSRDRVLWDELTTRTIDDEVLPLILGDGSDAGLHSYMMANLRQGRNVVTVDFVEKALGIYEQLKPRSIDAATRLFRRASDPCIRGVESLAVKAVREGSFNEGGLDFLRSCASSKEGLDVLASKAANPQPGQSMQGKVH